MSDEPQLPDTNDQELHETVPASDEAGMTASYRIVEGASPALEFDCPAYCVITAAKGAFLAKAPAIAVEPHAEFTGLDNYRNDSNENEILYLSPSSTGSLIAFHMQIHKNGLILSSSSLFAVTHDVALSLVVDVELEGLAGPYQLYQVTGEGTVVAFMSGDLFPLTLDDDDVLQVDARALAAMAPSIGFELEQLANGQYVASLTGPGRVWLQSMPSQ
ncbi:MAG: AIM24 family protein [Candidatus Puniceispirillaceae bacterium]